MPIDRYDQLRVYGTAFEGAMQIFDRSRHWPKDERHALTDQIRRSSRSVCANIAEAWCKRRFEKHFVSKLTDALAEAEETRVWIRFAARCAYIEEGDASAFDHAYATICGGLINMLTAPEKWCGPANLVREELAEYIIPE